MKKYQLLFGFVLLLVFVPTVVGATTTKRTGASISLATDEVVEGNFYAVGNTVSITGEVDGDAILAGGSVTALGTVREDALIIAGVVNLSGSTTDDVRIVAGEVTVSGYVGGSLSILASNVKILSTAVISGDVMIYGGNVQMEGTVEGFIYGATESLRIDGTVTSGIDVTTQSLILGNRSMVQGNITYVGTSDLVRAPEASVGGKIVKNSPPRTQSSFSPRAFAINFFILLFTVLVLYLVARPRVERFVTTPMFTQYALLRAVLFGFLFLFVPVAIAVLVASVLGSIIGFLLFLIYATLLIVALPSMVYVTAGALLVLLKQKQLTLLHLIVAALLVVAVGYLPTFGLVVLASLYLFTVGLIVSQLLGKIRR